MDNSNEALRTNSRLTQFIIWFLFIAAGFSVGVRLGTRRAMNHGLGVDDKLIIGSLVIYLGQCIAISVAVSADVPISNNSNEGSNSFMKGQYASVPLLILVLTLVKWSNSAFIRQLSPKQSYRKSVLVLSTIVGIWLVSATVAGLFQCSLPTPWDITDSSRCINRLSWWTFTVVINVITDIGLVVLYFSIIAKLQLSRTRKASIIMAFSTRLIVVGIALGQLATFLSSKEPMEAVASSLRLPLVLNQAVLSSSVITACVPYMKPFMQSLQTGIHRINNTSAFEDELMHLPRQPLSSHSNDTPLEYQGRLSRTRQIFKG
ncbi:hypothetical protein NPX13_g1662 [Xylaria arbuscula]|uniref:Rhodopsin domain-containing protein n=1 Tax=Xylaria arbuscula TaxID=114810 RepID=A0A9W8NM84_9PEZI|nr:hypothetical protein NPX13_g1662 [Xylaria arbuscula]